MKNFLFKFLFENITPKQTVLKNTFWLYFSNFFLKITKIIIIFLSAKYLGSYGYGYFSYILAIVNYFFLFVDWGSVYLFVRDYQNEENKKYLTNNFISFRLVLLLISFCMIIFGFLFFKDWNSRIIFLIIFIFLTISQLKYILYAIFKAIKRFEYESITNLIEGLVILLFTFILVQKTKDPLFLSISYLIGILISFLFTLFLFSKVFNLKDFNFHLDKARYFFINGTPLMFFDILLIVFFTADQIILGYFRGYQEVGYYSLVTKLITNLVLIIGFFLSAFLPFFAEIKNDINRVLKILNKVLILNLIIYLLVCFLGFILIEPIFKLFFNKEYLSSITLFKFLVLSLLLITNIYIFDYALFIYNKVWQNFFATSICVILNVILNFILIPPYGIYGAALATYISQVLNLILTYYLVKKYILRKVD